MCSVTPLAFHQPEPQILKRFDLAHFNEAELKIPEHAYFNRVESFFESH